MIRATRGAFSGPALICALVVGVAELVVLFTRTSWIGLLGYTPEWSNAGLFVASPLIAGTAAFLTRGYFSDELVAITGARRAAGAFRAVVSAWFRVLVLAALTHLSVMGIALTVTLVFGASGTLAWEPFVYSLAPIAMAAAIGVALASILPFLWTTAVAVIVTYGFWYVAVVTDSLVPSVVGGATISLAGLAYSPGALMLALAAAAVTTTVFLLVGSASVRSASPHRGVGLLGAAIVCILVGGAILGARLDTEQFVASGNPRFVCVGGDPKVCLTADHATRLNEIAHNVDAAAAPLRAADVDLTDIALYEDVPAGDPRGEGVLLLPFGQLNGINVHRADYAQSLLRPTNCAEYYSPSPTPELDRLLTASSAVGDWLNAKISGITPRVDDDRVRRLFEELRACAVSEKALSGVRAP